MTTFTPTLFKRGTQAEIKCFDAPEFFKKVKPRDNECKFDTISLQKYDNSILLTYHLLPSILPVSHPITSEFLFLFIFYARNRVNIDSPTNLTI